MGSIKFCIKKQNKRSCSEHFPHPQRLSQGHLSPALLTISLRQHPLFIILVSQTKRIAHCEVSCGFVLFYPVMFLEIYDALFLHLFIAEYYSIIVNIPQPIQPGSPRNARAGNSRDRLCRSLSPWGWKGQSPASRSFSLPLVFSRKFLTVAVFGEAGP